MSGREGRGGCVACNAPTECSNVVCLRCALEACERLLDERTRERDEARAELGRWRELLRDAGGELRCIKGVSFGCRDTMRMCAACEVARDIRLTLESQP